MICGRFCAISRPRNAIVGEYSLQYRSVAAVVWVHVSSWSAALSGCVVRS